MEYDVDFRVPTVTCVDTEDVPWMECVPDIKTQMTSKMVCEPKSKVECSPVSNNFCTTVTWQESYEQKFEQCNPNGIYRKPYQVVDHKKKCLLPDAQTSLPTAPLRNLQPGENLPQNLFRNPNVNGKRSVSDFTGEGRPSPVFVASQEN